MSPRPGTNDRKAARKRLGLADNPPANRRQAIPKVKPPEPESLDSMTVDERLMFDSMSYTCGPGFNALSFARIMLRGAAREYNADSEANGPEAMALDRAALRYAAELLASEDQVSGNFSDARDALDRFAQALARKLK